jgi:hypothetical protein
MIKSMTILINYDPLEDAPEHEYHCDQDGEFQHRLVATYTIIPEAFFDAVEYVDFDDLVDDFIYLLYPESVSVLYIVNLTDASKVNLNFKLLHPLFGWDFLDTIQHTFGVITQFAFGRVSNTLM